VQLVHFILEGSVYWEGLGNSSKAATLGRNWNVLGDTSPGFLAMVVWTQQPVEDLKIGGFYCALLLCSCSE